MALLRLGSGWRPRIERAVGEVAANVGQGPISLVGPLERLVALHDLVVEWNARTDLTAARTPDELVDLLVADATLLALRGGPGTRWVDVGSGANWDEAH